MTDRQMIMMLLALCAAARRARSREKAGFKTGASTRNWAGYGAMVDIRNGGDLAKTLLTDPQTSGGLLLACEPGAGGGTRYFPGKGIRSRSGDW